MDFDNIYAQLAGCAGKRQPIGTTLKGLKLPADGSPLSLIQLKTIEANAHLFREPDLTAFWGSQGPRHGNPQMLEVDGLRDGRFEGVWYFFKSADSATGPANKYYGGAYGDVFLVKMDPLEFGEGAIALYDDVPEDWEQSEGIMSALQHFKPK